MSHTIKKMQLVIMSIFIISCAAEYNFDDSWRVESQKLTKDNALKNIKEILEDSNGQAGLCNTDGSSYLANPKIIGWNGYKIEIIDYTASLKSITIIPYTNFVYVSREYEDKLVTKISDFEHIKWLKHYPAEIYPKNVSCTPKDGTKTFHIRVRDGVGMMVNVKDENIIKLFVSAMAISPNVRLIEVPGF